MVTVGRVSREDIEFGVTLFEGRSGRHLRDYQAGVRAIHVSPDALAVDIAVNGGALGVLDGVELDESSGYVILSSITF